MTMPTGAKESAYRALSRSLREDLLGDRFGEERQLPTEAELAKMHGVSRQTVRRAMQDLVAEGMIYRVRGRGTFPALRTERYLRQFGSVEDLMALALDTDMKLMLPLHRRVDPEAAGRLRQPSDMVSSVSFLRLHDGVPFCYTSVYLPTEIGRLLKDVPAFVETGTTTPTTVLGTLDKRLAKPIVVTDQSITVAVLGEAPAEALGCPVGQVVMRIDRVYFEENDKPVELAISWFHPERYSYRVRLQRSHL